MHRELIRDGILVALAGRYKEDPVQFMTLSKGTLDSAIGREIVAELRNEGHVEEQQGVTAVGREWLGFIWAIGVKAESKMREPMRLAV